MKRKLIYGTVVPFLSIAVLLNCNRDNKYAIRQFIEVKPEVYSYTIGGYTPTITKNETLSGKTYVYFINGNDIPYISIKIGVDDLYLNTFHIAKPDIYAGYSHLTKDNKTIITNNANNTTCVIDYNNQTMEFNNYIAFLNNDIYQLNPLDNIFTEGRKYFKDIKSEKYVDALSSYVIDFKKYNIPLFCKDNVGYIPNEVFNNVLNNAPIMDVTYFNNKIYVNTESYPNEAQLNNKITLNKVINGSFSSKYMEYCYNLNALTLDVNFGNRVRESRALSGHTIKYNLDAYSNMNKHDKNNFLSNKPNIANQALIDTINNEYDDSGHTLYTDIGLLENKLCESNFGYETLFHAKTLKSFDAARKEVKLDPVSKTLNNNAIGYFEIFKDSKGNNDTAFLTMDKFVGPTSGDYKQLEPCSNTLSLVYDANNKLKENNKIKNLIIDLSLNGGGLVLASLFMSSWLTKGTSHLKMCSFNNNTYSDISYKADVNGDGIIDNNDYLPDSVENVYVIVTPNSYSCGNLLPCDLRDYASTKLIGNRTGGGCCIVRPNMQTGYGSLYQMSSNYVLCRKDSNENNMMTNDDGVGVETADDIAIPLETPYLYYNRQAIYDAITQ